MKKKNYFSFCKVQKEKSCLFEYIKLVGILKKESEVVMNKIITTKLFADQSAIQNISKQSKSCRTGDFGKLVNITKKLEIYQPNDIKEIKLV